MDSVKMNAAPLSTFRYMRPDPDRTANGRLRTIALALRMSQVGTLESLRRHFQTPILPAEGTFQSGSGLRTVAAKSPAISPAWLPIQLID